MPVITKDGFCTNCKCYHYPDRRYEDDCGRPYVPLKRAPQPTTEEIHAQRLQALQEKHAAENRERQREQERLERKKTLERAMFQEDMRRFHQQQEAARAMKAAQVKAAMAEAREWMKRQAQVRRLERKLEDRAQKQRAKDNKRAQQLTDTIAARERRRSVTDERQLTSPGSAEFSRGSDVPWSGRIEFKDGSSRQRPPGTEEISPATLEMLERIRQRLAHFEGRVRR
jgi:hypothetical protein